MVDHVISSMNEVVSYDYSSSHRALDIVGGNHTSSDVIAISDGIVEMVVNNVKYTNHKVKGTASYGNFIKIKHENGKKSLYAHLKYGSVSARIGDKVSKGEVIGTMGATGNAYGTHLHFEVRNSNEARENPKAYLSGQASLNPVSNVSAVEKPSETVNEDTKKEPRNLPEEDLAKTIEDKTDTKKAVEKPSEVKTYNANEKPKVIIQNNNTSTISTLEKPNYNGGSIVDGLKSLNIDSSFDNRSAIASLNGIDNYRGSYDQNVYLLSLLKQGKLKA